MHPTPFFLALSLLSTALAFPAPQVPGDSALASEPTPELGSGGSTGTAPSCTHPFSCHATDAQGNPLLRGVPGALSPASYYSIFECVYAGPRTEGGVKMTISCSYDKITGVRYLRPLPDPICQPLALPCVSDPNFNPNPHPTPGDASPPTPPLFSSQDEEGKEVVLETPPWMPMGRDLMRLKMEHV